jgi:hypothetical protein
MVKETALERFFDEYDWIKYSLLAILFLLALFFLNLLLSLWFSSHSFVDIFVFNGY